MTLLPPSSESAPNGILFLCEANSARSQMAEGFAKFLGPAQMRIFSAGPTPGSISPFAVRAMKEVGIDISTQRAKGLADIPMAQVSTLVSLCAAKSVVQVLETLPSGVLHLAWPLPDPAQTRGPDDEILGAFRRVRDQIRELVSRMF